MTYAGASGKTAAEMAKVLHFTLPQDQLHPAFGAWAATFQGDTKKQGYQLCIANRLWGQAGYVFLPKFLQITRDDYGAELAQVDFARPEAARQTINTWVEDQTEKKIKNLIAPGVLNAATTLVLTNATYFKGDWDRKFNSRATKDAPFRITADKQINVSMMHQTDYFPYRADEGVQILELPYDGRDASMVIVLPDAVDGLGNLERRITPKKLGDWIATLREREAVMAEIYLPKFRTVSEFRLDPTLRSMGMPLAFSDEADFSGMDGKHDLYLRAVIHKAFIDVNEVGTEAAAATAMPRTFGLPDNTAPVFRADHPFLFLIRDNRTGSILFLGRVVNPKESAHRWNHHRERQEVSRTVVRSAERQCGSIHRVRRVMRLVRIAGIFCGSARRKKMSTDRRPPTGRKAGYPELLELAKQKFDQDEMAKQQARFLQGAFTLDDFKKLLGQTRKLGPLNKILSVLPGMGGMSQTLAELADTRWFESRSQEKRQMRSDTPADAIFRRFQAQNSTFDAWFQQSTWPLT